MLTNKPFAAGVTPLKVYFPSPSKSNFERSEPSMQGFPQVFILFYHEPTQNLELLETD